MRKILLLGWLGSLLATFSIQAAHTQAHLILSAGTAKPGDTVWAGVDLKMDAGWHTYWKNPGDSGIATTVKWDLPAGVSAGEILWPLPEKLPPAEVTTYGYENEVMLLVPLTLATNLPPGPLDLKADVAWLECMEQCVPGSGKVEAGLIVGGETTPSPFATTLETWRARVPKPADGMAFHAWWEKPADGDTRPLIIQTRLDTGASQKIDAADFFPDASDNFEVQARTELISNTAGEFDLRTRVKKLSGDWPSEIGGVMVIVRNGNREGYLVRLPVGDLALAAAASTSGTPDAAPPAQSLGQMLLYAFIGGLILNLMPCVLPVIALKILGFVGEAKSEPRHVRRLGLIYALGVLLSFLALAGVVLGVKAAGHHAGWGMQFGSPVFIVCLTTLVTLVALNLFGVFEVTLGGRALDAAGQLASRSGAAGAFFNGVLATVLATPCTAPFLGAALGFAFAQSGAVIVSIFLAVAVGLASPYVVLSWNPAWLKFLPKPGAWMEKFKIAMGFPMLATVVWLTNIAASSYGKNVLWLGVFLVIVAFAAWIFGEFFQRGRSRRGVSLALALVVLAGGYGFALEKELNWRAAAPPTGPTGSLRESEDGIDWQRWTPEAVAQARAAGKPVLVDFTADWCLTCQVNKKTSIEIPSVREKLRALNAAALLGDYTHFPDAITTELNRFNRAGVPLVLVFPKNPDAAPIVLPEVLTPGIVLAALDRAGN